MIRALARQTNPHKAVPVVFLKINSHLRTVKPDKDRAKDKGKVPAIPVKVPLEKAVVVAAAWGRLLRC